MATKTITGFIKPNDPQRPNGVESGHNLSSGHLKKARKIGGRKFKPDKKDKMPPKTARQHLEKKTAAGLKNVFGGY